jgi:hypothetical protein
LIQALILPMDDHAGHCGAHECSDEATSLEDLEGFGQIQARRRRADGQPDTGAL